MTHWHLVTIAAVLAGGASSPAAAGPFNTALTATEVSDVMDGRCSGFKSHAIAASPHLKWDPAMVVNKAAEVLRSNMPIEQIQKLIRDAEALGARGNKWEQDIAQFQICLLDNKIYYAELREQRAKR